MKCNDERFLPGAEMIKENQDLHAQVRQLQKQLNFYRDQWGMTAAQLDAAEACNAELRARMEEMTLERIAEVDGARRQAERAALRARDPYIQRIYAVR